MSYEWSLDTVAFRTMPLLVHLITKWINVHVFMHAAVLVVCLGIINFNVLFYEILKVR